MKMKRFDYLVRQNIGGPGFISMRNAFPLIPVFSKPCQLPYGANNICFLVYFFGKLIYLIAPEMVPWLYKKSEDQSGGPRTNLEVFGGEVSFQYFQKHENRFSPCHVRPNPAKGRGNLFVWSVPSPRTAPDLPNSI